MVIFHGKLLVYQRVPHFQLDDNVPPRSQAIQWSPQIMKVGGFLSWVKSLIFNDSFMDIYGK